MHGVIVPLAAGLLYLFIVIINVSFNRWLEPAQFLLRGTEYGYIIPNVELKVEIQHQVMLLIQYKLIYHFYSSDLKCLRHFYLLSITAFSRHLRGKKRGAY